MSMLEPDSDKVRLSSIPCSLQKFVHTAGYLPNPSGLTVEQRQLLFQHWVAYDLYSDRNRPTTKRIKCPLSGCELDFENLESCLAHLTKCAWLLNAWYWCPFCSRPESFTDWQHSSTSRLEPGAYGGNNKSPQLPDHSDSKSKSGAARFLKTIGSKLAFLSQISVSRSSTRIHASQGIQDLTQPSLALAEAMSTVIDKRRTVATDSATLPSHDSMDSSAAAICESECSGARSVLELDGNIMQPAELWGMQYSNTSYPLTAELPNHSYDGRPPLELMGSNPFNLNVSHQWLSGKQWSSDCNIYPGSTLQSTNPSASVANLPLYTPQAPQPEAFPHGNLQDGSPLETLRNRSNRAALPKSTRLQNTAMTDHSKLHYEHVAHQPYHQGICSSLPVHTDSSVDTYQIPSMNGIHDTCPRAGTLQSQPPSYHSSWSQDSLLEDQFKDPRMMCPHDGTLLPKHAILGSTPCPPDHSQGQKYSTQRTNIMLSSIKQPPRNGQQQTFCAPPLGPDPFHSLQETQDQAILGSPPPLNSVSRQETFASLTSPTESRVSSSRDSDRLNGANNTPPTSVETSLCPSCSKEFKGSFQDRRSNLNRHLRYSHGPQEKFKCPKEGCKKEYSRPDNLLKHRRNDHRVEQQLKRSNARTVRRNL